MFSEWEQNLPNLIPKRTRNLPRMYLEGTRNIDITCEEPAWMVQGIPKPYMERTQNVPIILRNLNGMYPESTRKVNGITLTRNRIGGGDPPKGGGVTLAVR